MHRHALAGQKTNELFVERAMRVASYYGFAPAASLPRISLKKEHRAAREGAKALELTLRSVLGRTAASALSTHLLRPGSGPVMFYHTSMGSGKNGAFALE